MTAHLGRASATAAQDGIERLVEAERAWQEALEAARAEGERVIAAAEASAAKAEVVFEASIPELVVARRRQNDAETAAEVQRVIEDLTRRARRYSDVPEALVVELAERIAATAPWVCTVDDGGDS